MQLIGERKSDEIPMRRSDADDNGLTIDLFKLTLLMGLIIIDVVRSSDNRRRTLGTTDRDVD